MNELQLQYQEGKRAAPAFSLVTVENLDTEETWQGISKELESTNLEVESISTNQGFIRAWIDQVMLADVDEKTGKCLHSLLALYQSLFVLRNALDDRR